MKSDAFVSKVGWGAYKDYEGPFFLGNDRYTAPGDPTFWQKVLAVITATEGGRFGAVNMYDRCILSVGLIQWCEAAPQFSCSNMLGKCAEADSTLLRSYLEEMPGFSGFSKDAGGRWRFSLPGTATGRVLTQGAQRSLFFGGASVGKKGTWTSETKGHARRVAAVMSAMWGEEVFRKVQIDYTTPKLPTFAAAPAREALFGKGFPEDGWEGALRAGFISFAANLPAVAVKQFRAVVATPGWGSKDPKDKCLLLFKQMTFAPQIAIYPARYNAIRPVIEKLFSVDLPDFAKELAVWKEETGHRDQESSGSRFDLLSVTGIQNALLYLGYDLGPKGADGSYGPKTKAAVKSFQAARHLKVDGEVGKNTRAALEEATK